MEREERTDMNTRKRKPINIVSKPDARKTIKSISIGEMVEVGEKTISYGAARSIAQALKRYGYLFSFRKIDKDTYCIIRIK